MAIGGYRGRCVLLPKKSCTVLAVLTGVTGALLFGSADFAGGMAAKRISAVRVTAIGGLSGLVILLVPLPIFPSVWSMKAVLLGYVAIVVALVAVVFVGSCP